MHALRHKSLDGELTYSTVLTKYCEAIPKGTCTNIYLIIHVISLNCVLLHAGKRYTHL